MLKMKKIALCAALATLSVATVVGFASCAGEAGPAGPKGDKGDQGIQGPAGEKGEDGKDGAGFEWNEDHSAWELVLSPWTDKMDGVILVADKTTGVVQAEFKDAGCDLVFNAVWGGTAENPVITATYECKHDDHEGVAKITVATEDIAITPSGSLDAMCGTAGYKKYTAVASFTGFDGQTVTKNIAEHTYDILAKGHDYDGTWALTSDEKAYFIVCKNETKPITVDNIEGKVLPAAYNVKEAVVLDIDYNPVTGEENIKTNGYWKLEVTKAATAIATGEATMTYVFNAEGLDELKFNVVIEAEGVLYGAWKETTGDYAFINKSVNEPTQIIVAKDQAELDAYLNGTAYEGHEVYGEDGETIIGYKKIVSNANGQAMEVVPVATAGPVA